MRTLWISLLPLALAACLAAPGDITDGEDNVDGTATALSLDKEQADPGGYDILEQAVIEDWDLRTTIDALESADLGGGTVGGGLDTLDPKNGVSEVKCYPTGCICSTASPRPGDGCKGLDSICGDLGIPILCTPRGTICGCFSRIKW